MANAIPIRKYSLSIKTHNYITGNFDEQFHELTKSHLSIGFHYMIILTENAATRIQQLRSEIADDSKYLRLFVETGGCSGLEYGMSFDDIKDDDVVEESQEIKFIIDPKSMVHLDGCRVDFDDGLNGKGFEIHNPNAQTTCGCGKSFN